MMPAAQESSQASGRLSVLFANRAFIRIWLCSLLSGLSFSAYLLAESWYVINELNERAWLGIIMTATTLPRLIFMLIGGALADRMNKTRIMALSALAKAVLLLLMAAMAASGYLTVYPLLFFAFFFGIADAFFGPAMQSLVPSMLPGEQLLRGNSLVQTGNQAVTIIGPIVGGLLLDSFSYPVLFASSGCALLLSGLLLLKVRTFEQPPQSTRSFRETMASLADGLRYLKTAPLLLSLGLMNVCTNFFIAGPGSMSIPLIANDVLRGSAASLSYLESAIALGMIGGAVAVGAINPKRRRGYLLLGQLLMLGILFVLLSGAGGLWQVVLLFAVLGAVITFGSIPMQTMIQQQTDRQMLGRVMAMMTTVSTGLVPLSFVATSFVLSLGVSITALLFVCGCITLAYFLLVALFGRNIRAID